MIYRKWQQDIKCQLILNCPFKSVWISCSGVLLFLAEWKLENLKRLDVNQVSNIPNLIVHKFSP